MTLNIVQEKNPKEIKNVLIMLWGSEPSYDEDDYRNDMEYIKDETTIPSVPIYITQGFQPRKTVGEASNFQKTEEGVTCDVKITDEYFKALLNEGLDVSLAPKLEGELQDDKFVDASIESVSIVFKHARPSLHGNVTKAMNT